MFDTELKYFIEHQDELVKRYQGTVLVIKGSEVVGAFPSTMDAYLAAREQFELGTFMLQECEPGIAAYTVCLD